MRIYDSRRGKEWEEWEEWRSEGGGGSKPKALWSWANGGGTPPAVAKRSIQWYENSFHSAPRIHGLMLRLSTATVIHSHRIIPRICLYVQRMILILPQPSTSFHP